MTSNSSRLIIGEVRTQRQRWFPGPGIPTTVIGDGQDGGKLSHAGLGQNTETVQGALLAGDVEGSVPTVIHQLGVTAGL